MKLLLIACIYSLTACATSTLSPEHSRERIVGLILMVERIETRAAPQAVTVQYPSPPQIVDSAQLPSQRYIPKSPYAYK